jgi:hypothetical protein
MNGEPWVDKSEEHNLHQEHNLKVQETWWHDGLGQPSPTEIYWL